MSIFVLDEVGTAFSAIRSGSGILKGSGILNRTVALGIAMLIAGCSGGQQGTVTPMGALAPSGPGIQTVMQTPKSVSPASISAPPMPQTAILPASAMLSTRRPQSAIERLGWTQLFGSAENVAASPDGSIWVVSSIVYSASYGNLIWHYVNGTWTNISGAATRLAVAPDNSLWAVNRSGGIYHYANGSWSTIAGGAGDISLGPDGSVYVISNVPGNSYGNGIWHYVNGAWTQLPGAAVRIAASWDTGTYSGNIAPGGFYVTNAPGSIYYHNPSSGYAQLPGAALQVAPTTSGGGLFAIGYPASAGIFYNDLSTDTWTQEPGAGVSIATNGAIVYVVNAAGDIFTSAVRSTASPTPTSSPATGTIVVQ
jgi:hypothetical protein